MIDENRLGKLIRITEARNISYFNNRPQWFLEKELAGGGMVMNYGAHSLDKIYYLTGSVISDITTAQHGRAVIEGIEKIYNSAL